MKLGRINADLTIGVDVTTAEPLRANDGLSSPGVKLHGSGFIITPEQAEHLGLRKRAGLDRHIRPYRNGRDLTAYPRGVLVIDLFGLAADDVRQRYPEVYQHVLQTVKPERDRNNRASYKDNWWVFGEPRRELRPALSGLLRYVATPVTQKHRTFVFIAGDVLPDDALICMGVDDGYILGVLSSRVHAAWINASGGTLEDRPRYLKSLCFDPFSFPECSDDLKARIRAVAEELDAHRKRAQAEHPRLTLTQIYNVLEKLKANEELDADDERIKTEGLVLILKELHEKLDALAFEAYGWPATLTDEEILTRLVELNRKRSLEEKVGIVKWLRPDYQIPRFGSDAECARLAAEKAKAKQEELALADDDDDEEAVSKPKFQTGNELAETADVMRVLATASEPLSIERIARSFSQGKAIEKRVAMTILALARLGHVSSHDDGAHFVLRR